MNWKLHAPTPWKIATLKSLIKRAFLISSTQASLEDELIYLKRVFCTLGLIMGDKQSVEEGSVLSNIINWTKIHIFSNTLTRPNTNGYGWKTSKLSAVVTEMISNDALANRSI